MPVDFPQDRRTLRSYCLENPCSLLSYENGRFIDVDLTGRLVVRGAILGRGFPTIVKGQGPVTLKSTLQAAPIQASAQSGE